MSTAVFNGEALRDARQPSWPQSVGAVLVGFLFGYVLSLVWMLPLALLGLLPVTHLDGVSGHGWPWRIDGPWSLAADLGPLLLAGLTMAYGIELMTFKWTGVSPRRLPFVIVAVTLGWLPYGVGDTGLLGATGAVAFFAMVWVTRTYAGRASRPLRWTRPRALLAVAVVLGLTATSLSFSVTHPLEFQTGSQASSKDGETGIWLNLHNNGPLDVRMLGVDPRAEILSESMTGAFESATGAVIAHGAGETFWLTVRSHGCAGGRLDGIGVRLRVAGHDFRQVVHLAAHDLDCQ